LVQKSSLECDLAFTPANFNCLAVLIKNLDSNNILLIDSLDLVESVFTDLKKIKRQLISDDIRKIEVCFE
jgi:hypothetical protein